MLSLSLVTFKIIIDPEQQRAHATGAKSVILKLSKSGFKTINTPQNPTKIADHLLIPIFSFKKIIAKIETKKGQQKNNAFAVASVAIEDGLSDCAATGEELRKLIDAVYWEPGYYPVIPRQYFALYAFYTWLVARNFSF